MLEQVGNPEDRFSHNEAHIKVVFEVLVTWACAHDGYLVSFFTPDLKSILCIEAVGLGGSGGLEGK